MANSCRPLIGPAAPSSRQRGCSLSQWQLGSARHHHPGADVRCDLEGRISGRGGRGAEAVAVETGRIGRTRAEKEQVSQGCGCDGAVSNLRLRFQLGRDSA